MVGCVIAVGDQILAEGWHERFGCDHAEVEALREFKKRPHGEPIDGLTLYVTLEPCCHQGKTPPCTEAILASGIQRVVVAMADPFPEVAGRGIQRLREAGVAVELGVGEADANALAAPYIKLQRTGRPWILAKWAMTLDGRMASRTGHSQWISSTTSREIAHQIRGRVDGVLVGIGTVLKDDPLLTSRPAGVRVASRIIVDSKARLPQTSQLVRTCGEAPVLVAVGPDADLPSRERLESRGVEVLACAAPSHDERLQELLDLLGRRQMTNVLVEGGAQLLGSLFDAGEIDEVHAFIGSKLVGGRQAVPVMGGEGTLSMRDALQLERVEIQQFENDVYVQGRVIK